MLEAIRLGDLLPPLIPTQRSADRRLSAADLGRCSVRQFVSCATLLRSRSSTGQSAGFLNRRLAVRVRPRSPTSFTERWPSLAEGAPEIGRASCRERV